MILILYLRQQFAIFTKPRQNLLIAVFVLTAGGQKPEIHTKDFESFQASVYLMYLYLDSSKVFLSEEELFYDKNK